MSHMLSRSFPLGTLEPEEKWREEWGVECGECWGEEGWWRGLEGER